MGKVTEYAKAYQEYKAELDAELNRTAEGFVKIGYLLKVARDTNVLAESGYDNVVDFAHGEYNIDKTQVSRFIHINDRFSEGGYGYCLKEHYRGFGYAKLTLMLQLPEEINEELTPEFSKSEIQDLKDEVDEENKVTDIERILEGEADTTAAVDDELKKTIRQLGEDEPELYATMWKALRKQVWEPETMQSIMAPSGLQVHSIRIRGIGRKMLMMKDRDNGDEVVLVDVRSNEKSNYSWTDLMTAWKEIVAIESDTEYKGAWKSIYYTEWPIKEKVVPVQQKEEPKKQVSKKESKVKKAPVTKPKKTEQVKKQEDKGEEQIPGQDNIMNHPEYMPESNEQTDESTEYREIFEEQQGNGTGSEQNSTECVSEGADLEGEDPEEHTQRDGASEIVQPVEDIWKEAKMAAEQLKYFFDGNEYKHPSELVQSDLQCAYTNAVSVAAGFEKLMNRMWRNE